MIDPDRLKEFEERLRPTLDSHRRELLLEAGIAVPAAVADVPETDLLDAAAGAWTALPYACDSARSGPSPDCY